MIKLSLPIFRGYVNHSHGNGLVIKDEYIVLSLKKVKFFFIDSKEPDLSEIDSNFLSELDYLNFWLLISIRKKYWHDYLNKGHVISKFYGYPEWVGRSIIAEDDMGITLAIENLIKYLDTIRSNKIDTFFKLQSLIPSLEPLIPSDCHLKHIYSCCSVPLGNDKMDYKINIDEVQIAECGMLCWFYCNAEFDNDKSIKSKLHFKILALTPEYFKNEISVDEWIFPPHIIIENLNISKIEEYLLKTLNMIQASGKLDLILKLSIFTNSFLDEGAVKERLYSDFEYEIKTKLFDLRPLT